MIRTRRSEGYSRTQSFTCSSGVLRAFERRALELGCTFDWLLEEAMQRLLAESRAAPASPPTTSTPQGKPKATSPTGPLPRPPDALPSTLPPPQARRQLRALAPPPSPAPRSRAAVPVDVPLVLDVHGERLVIDWQPYVIGRSSTVADLVIEDAAVSRRHAAIEQLADGWVITDLGSTNGIVVNGERVRHSRLEPGMALSIGPMTFGVRSF